MGTRFKAGLCGALGLAFVCGCAGAGGPLSVEEILRSAGLEQTAQLDEPTVIAGLKDALRVGTERAVAVTSQPDGFWADPRIRIPLPEQLDSMTRALRSVGFGTQIDEFELAMNRAAEHASGEARSVFWNAITQMSIDDAFQILNGADTAATDYFREHTSESLRGRFRPIVSEQMQRVGVYRVYDGLMSHYAALPLVSKPDLDLDSYVTQKAMDGLFTTLAGEERRIREDPAARSTELLRRVFGTTVE